MNPKPILLALLAGCAAYAAPLGTAFTYQGRLNDGAGPANGNYDLRFILYNADSGGSQIGPTLTNSAISVANGLFTTPLDFGGVFDGNGYWLEISVRTNGVGLFFPLNPRQQLTPTPYATTAGTLSGTLPATRLSGQLSGAQIADGSVNAAKIDNTQVQLRVTGTAAAGQFITGIAANGSVTVGADTTDWKLTGNNATGGQFLGSTNNQAVELRANNQTALRLQPSIGIPNVIGGSVSNSAPASIEAATIAGGGLDLFPNSVTASYGTVGGGTFNIVGGVWSTIAGGRDNNNFADHATIAGGRANQVGTNASYSTIAGGIFNIIGTNTSNGTISGGANNTNRASSATIGGGANNAVQASSIFSTIGGGNGNTVQNGAAESTVGGGLQNVVSTNAQYSTIGGGYGNTIQTNSSYSAIAGGNQNTASGFTATVGGGSGNQAAYDRATVAGGSGNTAGGDSSFIGGGLQNAIFNGSAAIVGGRGNTNDGAYAFIGAGLANTIYGGGIYGSIPGGQSNFVNGAYGFAAGQMAQANHSGAFVWADTTGGPFASTLPNQFNVRANGGARFETGGAGMTIDGQPVLTGTVGSSAIQDGSIANVDISATAAIAASKIAGGSGSGLDADLLDGLDSTAFATTGHDHYGQSWSGSAVNGLSVRTSSSAPSAVAGLRGIQGAGAGIFFGTPSGVWGESATGFGVLGVTAEPSEYGVYGYHFSTTGSGSGLAGETDSTTGHGVRGVANSTNGLNYGVHGATASTSGVGVYGIHTATTGTTSGVQGDTSSTSANAVGVLGQVTSTSPGGSSAAVRGINNGSGGLGIGVWGSQAGSGYGVYGTAPSGLGVYGSTTSGTGVFGSTTSGTGVSGSASTGAGVNGISTSGIGVRAESSSANIIEGWSTGGGRRFIVDNAGAVHADGAYSSPAADFAEMLPAHNALEPGDVLVVGEDGKLTRCTQAAQENVVGVYSTKPAFLGGAPDPANLEGKVPLAVVGVVPVKVTNENGAIKPGNLLVASSTAGRAMKAAADPKIGTVIGKALGRFDGKDGVVQMLVLQH